jgi:DNA-binding transcriptional MerR regulator
MQPVENQSVIVAMTEDHVARVTGISVGQLRAWDKRGFFKPNFSYDNEHSAYRRIYSFKDVVGLKTIATLRERYKIGFSKLQVVATELEARGYAHWADTQLFVLKKKVHFKDPRTGQVESLEDGQLAMLPIIDVIDEITRKVVDLKKRPETAYGKVERHRFVARNSWVVSGTRIPTATIRRYADAGFSIEKILEEYPTLTEDDVYAALTHEGSSLKSA